MERFLLRTNHQPLQWLQNFTESTGKLARLGLRLLEFDFKVVNRRVVVHQAADALSRLPSSISNDQATHYEISGELPPVMFLFGSCAHLQDGYATDEDDHCTESIASVNEKRSTAAGSDRTEPITIDQLITEQTNDKYVQQIAESIDRMESEFLWNNDGLFCRLFRLDGSHQIVVLGDLREKVLYWAHDSPLGRPPRQPAYVRYAPPILLLALYGK